MTYNFVSLSYVYILQPSEYIGIFMGVCYNMVCKISIHLTLLLYWHLNIWFFTQRDDLNQTEVQLGVTRLNASSPNKVTRKLSEIICHPEYQSDTFENDICLLKLSSPVNFTNYIQPVCLASENSTFHDGVTGMVTGFGVTGKLQDISFL